ncbi:ABC transporter ATP-binding protein/permease [Myxococcota bacterium]|nr:ABC transporter ATP-binding protein/permease [Myxococcota bacterium]
MPPAAPPAVPSPHPLPRLLRYGAAHRPAVAWAVTASVLNKLLDLAPPALIGMAVDAVVLGEQSLLGRMGVVDGFQQVLVITALTVVIWVLESVFEYAYGVAWRNLAQQVQHELRLDAYGHLQRLDSAWFQGRSTGGLLAVMNDDVNQLERFLDGGANELLQVATTVLVVTGSYVLLSPGVAGLSLLPIPLILWGSFRFQATIAPRYARVRERNAALSATLANNLGGIETIKSFSTEAAEVDHVRALSEDYRQANRAAISLSSAFSPLIRMAVMVGFVGTLVYGGWQALEGQIAVGSYSVFLFLTQRLLWPLTRLGSTFDLYQRAMASTTRILDLLDTPITVRDGTVPLPHPRGEVRFHGVAFAYPEGRQVLRAFDLDVPAGATVAVVGPTGAGKSTLVRLLLRLHDVSGGSITLDGHDLRELRLADLRGAIALVSQSPFLFPGSVRENIAYGSPGATLDQVRQAARDAEADTFVQALPQGYDTVVGERGQKLSGGQAQRLAIARALLKGAPILVLDEATSAVDNETEAAIQQSLARLHAAHRKTMIIIAHRLSTIRHADHIVVMDQGEVVQAGRHEELVARGGLYARLWAVQTGERAGGPP